MTLTKKRKKPTRTGLKRKADDLFRKVVRGRGYCQLAGKDAVKCGGHLETMHIEPRRNHRLRWEPLNALCGCVEHHRHYTARPTAWFAFIAAQFPENHDFVLAHVNEMWNKDYDAVISALKDSLSVLQGLHQDAPKPSSERSN